MQQPRIPTVEVRLDPDEVPFEWHDLITRITALIANMFEDCAVVPDGIILCKDHRFIELVQVSNENPDATNECIEEARKLAIEHEADCAILLAEAWAVESNQRIDGLEIKDHETKREIMSVALETKKGSYQGMGPILRDEEGKPRVEIFYYRKGITITGRFARILPGNY